MEGDSASDWRRETHTSSFSTAVSKPVHPLHDLLRRSEPAHCEHVLSPFSAGCQVDVLKLDCAACEWTVVRQLWDTAGSSVLQKVDQLLFELHLSDVSERLGPGGDVWKLSAILATNGFELFTVGDASRQSRPAPSPLHVPSPQQARVDHTCSHVFLSGRASLTCPVLHTCVGARMQARKQSKASEAIIFHLMRCAGAV